MFDGPFTNWLVGRPESDGEVQLQWLNLPSSWGVFVLLLVVALVVGFVYRLYQRERIKGPAWLRPVLLTLRLLTLLFLFLLFLQPSISLVNRVVLRPPVTIARDASASMANRDRINDDQVRQQLSKLSGIAESQLQNGEIPRQELINQLLGDGRNSWMEKLRDKGAVRIVDFATDVQNVTTLPARDRNEGTESDETDDTNPDESEEPSDVTAASTEQSLPGVAPLVPDGVSTNMSRVLSDLLSKDSNVGSIVLITDGQHNSSEDPMALAQKARRQNVPIYVVGVGDPTRPRNIAIQEVYVRSKVRPEEPFEIEALVLGEDLGQQAIQLTLLEQPLDPESRKPLGSAEEIAHREIQLPTEGGQARISFEHSQMESGLYEYRVVAETVENEIATTDNRRSSSPVEVIDDQVKVLLISGSPNWDYQQVLRLLQRDPSIQVASWLQSLDPERPQEGNLTLTSFPRSLEELGEFNVVILIDPDPSRDFDDEFMNSLRALLDTKAGGLLYMAGPLHTTEFLGRSTTGVISDLLPVQFGDAEQLDFQTTIAAATELAASGDLVAETPNLDHPVMSFHGDPARNQTQWKEMPNVFWTFPVASVKPATRTLLKKVDATTPENNQPILVAGRYSAGNVLFFGFNSTWRWRSVGVQAQYFDRFWIQVIRFLVESRSLQGQRRAIVETDRLEYDLGDRVRITARVLDTQYQPLNEEKVTATVTTSDELQLPVELKKVPGQIGEFQGVLTPQTTGQFQLSMVLPEAAGGTEQSDDQVVQGTSFRVQAPSLEASTYWLNEPLLRKIAETSGGKYFRIDQWEAVSAAVPEKTTETQYESRPEPLWDQTRWLRWTFFLIPVALLSLEWALRKRGKIL